MQIGQIVFSKAGRDKRRAFVVVKVEHEYVFLVDGSLRTLSKPKKKKSMHVQITNTIVEEIKDKLENNLYILDADFKKALKPYHSKESEE